MMAAGSRDGMGSTVPILCRWRLGRVVNEDRAGRLFKVAPPAFLYGCGLPILRGGEHLAGMGERSLGGAARKKPRHFAYPLLAGHLA